MFGKLWKYGVEVLNVVRMVLYVISAPFALVMTGYGLYFIVIGFAWIVLVDAAFVSALLIFTANFFMAFVAVFDGSVWNSMSSMWQWLWSWFADGNVALWPHFVKSFPPYFGAGIVFMLFINATEYLKNKATAIKTQHASNFL